MIRCFEPGGRFDLRLRGYPPHEAIIAASGAPDLLEVGNAVILSLCTDRQADEGTDLPWRADRGGWWAQPEAGSLLWTYRNRTLSATLLRDLERDARAALIWMEEAGLAAAGSIDVRAERQTLNMAALAVSLSEPRSQLRYDRRFSMFWEA